MYHDKHARHMAPLGAPRRLHRDVVRGIEAHFWPIITNNPSPIVIPQNANGRTFEDRTTALQSLPKFKGLATEEPYFHLEMFHEAFERFNMMLRNCPHHGIQTLGIVECFP